MYSRMRPGMLARQLHCRFNTTIASTVSYRCDYHNAERIALISPAEKIKWTYGELWGQILAVAGGLTKAGFQPGSVVATDTNFNSSSLLLQLAVAHNQMQLLTVQSQDEFERLSPCVGVAGVVAASSSSFLQGPTVSELQKAGGKAGAGGTDRNAPLAYYSGDGDIVTSNRQVYLHGVGIAGLLKIQPEEQVCVAASFNHAFGMGSIIGVIVRSGVIYLPDPEGMDFGDSTLLVADEHTTNKLPTSAGSSLRGGLVKVGAYPSHDAIPMIRGSAEVAGTRVYEVAADGAHPLFDACKDTYWPVEL